MDLCVAVFGHEYLATHSLSGVASNSMIGRGTPVKPRMDVSKTEAIIGSY